MGRDIHDALGGTVPIGLISSNWGGTPVQVWQPLASVRDCGSPAATAGGALYNSMVAPFAVGPMALTGASWYQGESNVGGAAFYACAFPSMIARWREAFRSPTLWFGFVQIAGYAYSHPYGPGLPETDHSHAAGDLRQAQLAALRLPPPIAMTTAIDTGDWTNIHPPDKQAPARRLANQALAQIYGHKVAGVDFPLYRASAVTQQGTTVTATVAVQAGVSGAPIALTTDAPAAATQSSTLGQPGSVPRTQCVTFGQPSTFPQDCGCAPRPLSLGAARPRRSTHPPWPHNTFTPPLHRHGRPGHPRRARQRHEGVAQRERGHRRRRLVDRAHRRRRPRRLHADGLVVRARLVAAHDLLLHGGRPARHPVVCQLFDDQPVDAAAAGRGRLLRARRGRCDAAPAPHRSSERHHHHHRDCREGGHDRRGDVGGGLDHPVDERAARKRLDVLLGDGHRATARRNQRDHDDGDGEDRGGGRRVGPGPRPGPL